VSTNSRRSPLRTKLRETVCETIVDAAEAVALESGLEAATAAAIAARAGVAVGTLYNYFPDRDGIVAALFRVRRAQILPAIEAGAERAAALPFEERLRSYVRDLLTAFEAQRGFLKLAVLTENHVASKRDKTLMTQVLQHLEQILREGAARKLVAAARVPAYARMLQGTLKALVLWRVTDGGSIAADADLAVDTFLRGVCK
jgi:AcrR family transcriptional regulator